MYECALRRTHPGGPDESHLIQPKPRLRFGSLSTAPKSGVERIQDSGYGRNRGMRKLSTPLTPLSSVFGIEQDNLREEESMPVLMMKETPRPASTATETKLEGQVRRRAYQ